MATHNVNVCNNFNASPGDTVNFSNSSGTTCNISQLGTDPWPFTSGPPLKVPPAGATTLIKSPLAPGTYNYNVDCCPTQTGKCVIVS